MGTSRTFRDTEDPMDAPFSAEGATFHQAIAESLADERAGEIVSVRSQQS